MIEVFRDDRTAIYQGSAYDPIPRPFDGARHHVITDPPFSSITHNGARSVGSSGAVALAGTGIHFDPLAMGDVGRIGEACALVATGWVLCFCEFEMLGTYREAFECVGLDYVRGQGWVKPTSTPQITGDRPGQWGEAIATAHSKGRKRWNAGGKAGSYSFPSREPGVERVHPTQKPIALMRELVERFTDPGDVIVDLFCGSGTTLRAARDLGRFSVGIELDPAFAAMAAERCGAPPAETDGRQRNLFFSGAAE